jgi:hypothetical protein
MIYECLVIDNKCFWKTGKIKVRVSKGIGQTEFLKDMSTNPQESLEDFSGFKITDPDTDETEIVETDSYAELSTCMGGAFDSGVFYLPQPNTRGLVAEIPVAGSTPRYVWMGAIMVIDPVNGPLANQILGPNDRFTKENNEDNQNLMNSMNSPNLDIPENANHAFIFKQKETSIARDDSDEIDFEQSKETLDWKKVPTYNMAVIDKSRVFLIHEIYDDEGTDLGTAKISIDNTDGVVISFDRNGENEDETSYSKMILDTKGNCSLTNTSGKITNKFEATPEDLLIYHANDKFNAQIGMTQDMNDGEGRLDMVLKRNSSSVESSVSIHKNQAGSNDVIDITSSGDITINPGANGKLTFGGGSGTGYLLVATHPGAISNFENETFTAVENIRI